MMLSCSIPRRNSVTTKVYSPVLPETPKKVKPKAKVVTLAKQMSNLAKYNRTANLSSKGNLEAKKLKSALEARKGKTMFYPVVKTQRPKLKLSEKKAVRKEVKNNPCPKIEPIDKSNYYWSIRDAKGGLIIPTHLMGKLKNQYKKYLK